MKEHFCTCPEKSCAFHPARHDEGCDLCIKKNLDHGEIPTCFWISVGGDLSGVEKYTVESFVNYFLRSRDR